MAALSASAADMSTVVRTEAPPRRSDRQCQCRRGDVVGEVGDHDHVAVAEREVEAVERASEALGCCSGRLLPGRASLGGDALESLGGVGDVDQVVAPGPRARRRVDPLRSVPRGPRDHAGRRRGGQGLRRAPGLRRRARPRATPRPRRRPRRQRHRTAPVPRHRGHGLSLRFRHDSPAHYIEQLEAMGEVAAAVDGG